jgi:hypothetical protein
MVYVRKNYTVGDYPDELKSKVYLLKHFEGYIMGKLYGDYEYTFLDLQRTKGMQFVQKYLRMKHVIVFKLSHDVLQVRPQLVGFLGRANMPSSSTFMTTRRSSYPHRVSLSHTSTRITC